MKDPTKRPAGEPALRSFVMSILVLAVLMLLAGVATRIIPSGAYQRSILVDGRMVLVPGSYALGPRPSYPVWRWLTAPVEVLASEDAALALVIIAFIVVVGGAFTVMRKSGVLEASVRSLSARFRTRRMAFLALVCLFFMASGSFMGLFEEVVPLVPLAVALSLSFGWDVFTGLGMSILAVGFGFSAAIANPFSIGTAQKLAGLPVLSGAPFRLISFICVYALYMAFMIVHVRRIEADNRIAADLADGSAGWAANHAAGETVGQTVGQVANHAAGETSGGTTGWVASQSADSGCNPARGATIFGRGTIILLGLIFISSITGIGNDLILPAIALGFLVIGFGAGLGTGLRLRRIVGSFAVGALAVLPAALLILMALAVKRIVVAGGIMDTILYNASGLMTGATGHGAALIMYAVTLAMNFFIGSASAKAFLLMPILAPLADLSGVSRQIAVQAFAFGDGFSNMLYPTNAVLLISLGLAGMSWGQWFRQTWKLQAAVLLLTIGLLLVAVSSGYS
jgi:uncharacterized ion transporter superfamily protein YfcC